MQIQYFKSAWGDIKNSPGWFGKICLLALINFIPIFGQIVTLGYVYGWAREIAWGTHEPMPAKIFGNEDGKLYRRGWFALVLGFVFAIIPYFVMSFGSGIQGWAFGFQGQHVNPFWMGMGSLIYLIGALLMVVVGVFAWIGNMRIAIYDRLSAGFQFRKLWNMLRHDTSGMLRIFGMDLLVGFIIAVVLSIAFSVLFVLVISIGVSGVIGAGYSLQSVSYMSGPVAAQFFASAGLIGFVVFLVCFYLAMVCGMFLNMLVVRAVGYWTMQFDVPHWGGQDEPMPFEVPQGQAQQAPVPPQTQPQPGPGSFSDPSSPYSSAYSVTTQTVDPGYTAPTPPYAQTDAPPVTYDEPAVVSADFIRGPEEAPTAPASEQPQVENSAEQGDKLQ